MKTFIIISILNVLWVVLVLPAGAQVKGKSLVIIDRTVRKAEVLIEQVVPGSKIVELSTTGNPLREVLEILKANAPVRSLHIFSAGRQAEMVFSDANVNVPYLELNAGHLEQWREYFSEGGDILLYGCEVAKGKEGLQFVQELAVLTGLDVAASDNHTGSWRKYGDWMLEVHSGRIETHLAVHSDVSEVYPAVLSLSRQE